MGAVVVVVVEGVAAAVVVVVEGVIGGGAIAGTVSLFPLTICVSFSDLSLTPEVVTAEEEELA